MFITAAPVWSISENFQAFIQLIWTSLPVNSEGRGLRVPLGNTYLRLLQIT